MHVVLSSSAAVRLDAARRFVLDASPDTEYLIVAASRAAADDFARTIARERRATFGMHRLSLTQLAARLAAPLLARDRLAPTTPLGVQAVAARALFDAMKDGPAGALSYFAPVADSPGFPRALARTLEEVSLAMVPVAAVRRAGDGGGDLATLLERFDEQFQAASAVDRARFLAAATRAAAERTNPYAGCRLLLIDVPIVNASERAFVDALVARARHGARDDAGGRRCLPGRAREYGEARGRRWSERWGRSGSPPSRSRAPLSVFTGGSATGRSPSRGRDVLGARRGARVRGDRTTGAPRGSPRRRLRSDRDRAASASTLRGSARARPRTRGRSRVLRAGHPAARTPRAGRFSRCCAAPSTICPRADSPSICRSARCRTAGPPPLTRSRFRATKYSALSASGPVARHMLKAGTTKTTRVTSTRGAIHRSARRSVRRGNGNGCLPNRAWSPPSSGGNVVCPASRTSASCRSASWRAPNRDRRASIT